MRSFLFPDRGFSATTQHLNPKLANVTTKEIIYSDFQQAFKHPSLKYTFTSIHAENFLRSNCERQRMEKDHN